MGATIKDIARIAGVSAAAVSKALNNQDDIGAELKEKVNKIAAEIGYSPNFIAKKLVTKKSKTIGLFILTRFKVPLEDNFGFKFFGGIIEEANKNGYDILLFSTDTDEVKQKSYITLCSERLVEGAIFIGLDENDKDISEIKNSSIPISAIDTNIDGEMLNYISTDNEKGVRMALDYLWELGHRKIAIVKGHENAQVTKIRYRAFYEYLLGKGEFREDYIFEGDFSLESGYSAGKKIAELENKPTAIFASNDMMAFGILKALKEKNILVPQDISIVGFDNISFGNFVEPAVTTIAQAPTEMGKEAVRAILDMINKNEQARQVLITPKLIIRNSCKSINV